MASRMICLFLFGMLHTGHATADPNEGMKIDKAMSKFMSGSSVHMPRPRPVAIADTPVAIAATPVSNDMRSAIMKTLGDLEARSQGMQAEYQRLQTRIQRMPQADNQASVGSAAAFFAGFIAAVGLAASVGVAAVKKYAGHAQHTSESTPQSQISLVPQRAGLIVASIAADPSGTEETEKSNAPNPIRANPKMQMEASQVERSPAMPFLPRPQNLKGWVGDKGFDPIGLSDWVPMEWLRESELKHGRVCMLAVVGFVATDLGFRLPGEMHQVASINAHDMAVDMGAMTQIGIWIAVCECIGYLAILEMLDGSGRQPGNFGFDPLQIGGANDPEMQLKELENGRLAMIGFAGIVTQAVLTGEGFPYMYHS